MPKSSTQNTTSRASAGSGGWFVWTVGLWVVFFVLLHNRDLDGVAGWIRGLPLPLELLVWLVFFPWVLATAVWTGGWPEGWRITLVVLFAVVWTLVAIPRPKQPQARRTHDVH
ncbi:hypothetical protein ACI2LF_12385 [Kribbella sp. NPDC020789]